MGEFFIGVFLIIVIFVLIPFIFIVVKSAAEVWRNIIHDIFKKGE